MCISFHIKFWLNSERLTTGNAGQILVEISPVLLNKCVKEFIGYV